MQKTFLSISILFSIFTCLQAQDTTQLKTVVITSQANEKTPITFQNINTKELTIKSVGQEPSILLSTTPSVTSYSESGGTQGYSYFRLRGIDQTRINFTLDGMPLNEAEDQGFYFSNFPDLLNSISKIQVQRGVGSTKNGNASYGGSLQLSSPTLSDAAQTNLGLSYGSYNTYRAFAEYNSGIKNNAAIYARASYLHSNGYKYHAGNTGQSAFVSGALFGKRSVWKFNGVLGHQQNGLAWLGVADSLVQKDRRTNGNSAGEKDDFLQTLAQAQHIFQINEKSSLSSSIYHSFVTGNYNFDYQNYVGLPSSSEMYNYAFKSNFIGVFSNYHYHSQNIKLTSGIHANTYNRRHIGSEKTLGKLYENTGYKRDLSVFTTAEYAWENLTLFGDLQYRNTHFAYKGTAKMSDYNWNFLNPKAGLSYAIKPNFTVYYSAGKTSREPTRNDMFGGNDDLAADSLGNGIIYINKAESVLDQELGIRYNTTNFALNVNVYYMDFKNEIILNGKFGPNGLALTNNVDKSIRTGLEISANYLLTSHWELVNNSSFNYSKITENKVQFSPILTPAILINQEIIYKNGAIRISLSGRYQSKSFMDFANSAELKGYFLFNSQISYTKKHYQLSLFANNLLNAKYYNSGYVEYDGITRKLFTQMPINFTGQVTFVF